MKEIFDRWSESDSANPEIPGYHFRLNLHGEWADWRGGHTTKDKTSPIGQDHLWHIGSCGKSFTGYLVHSLCKSGKVHLHDEVLPGINLGALLTHQSGIPDVYPSEIWHELFVSQDSPAIHRSHVFEYWQKANLSPQSFCYSNWNYILAAHHLERIFGCEFEALMSEEVFNPLQIRNYDWGAPGQTNPSLAVWGHRLSEQNLVSIAPTPLADNPSFFAPAGGLSLRLQDWSIFIETYQKILSNSHHVLSAKITEAQNYNRLGVIESFVKDEKVYFHNGSNTLWYSLFTIVPSRRCFWMLAVNSGTPKAQQAVDEFNGRLVQKIFTL